MEQKNSVIDNILFLYLMKDRQKFSQKKIVKLLFLSELEMEKDNLLGFDFHFIRYKYGPYAFEIPGIQDFLHQYKIIDSITLDFSIFIYNNSFITSYGTMLLNEFDELFKINKSIIQKIDSTLRKFSKFSGRQLEAYCYNLETNNVKIRDIPLYQTLLNPKKDPGNKKKFEIAEEWIETFYLLLDKSNYSQIKNAIAINRKFPATKYSN
ncbi:MAG: hypothetical protein HWN65_22705 [Candidatus Helarchaeota archaeon]|nr:hypothetical protein [Candidatus Helarchaeota archaeon]